MTERIDVHNQISGSVTGHVVQAGTINQLVLSPPAPLPAASAPRQLPPALRDFAGRADQLAALDTLLSTHPRTSPATMALAVLDGTAGVGKTTLAVHWAHRAQHHFPDGTLYADLRGYGPSAPVAPALVLAAFLRDLGVAEDRVPAELDAQTALYRSLLAERQTLILLDNAGSADQVRPLLPGAPECLVLVTSRANLTGLAVAEAATPLTVDLFTSAEAEDLVRGIIGPERADTEAAAVAELIRLCARLPLALRVAATRIAVRPHTTVADVVEDITSEESHLDTLSSSGDDRSAVRTVFDWSYTQLPADQALLFRRLGLHPGPEFGVEAAAVLAGIEPARAYRLLEALTATHLVEPVGRRRYRCHDLLHAYAAHRADNDDTAEDRRSATVSVITWYARIAQFADRLVFPGLWFLDSTLAQVGADVPLADRAQALAWLDAELDNLGTALRAAVRHQLHEPALCLAEAARFLTFRQRALWAVRVDMHTHGVDLAQRIGNRAAAAWLFTLRANTYSDLGRLAEAEADYRSELALAEELDNPRRHYGALVGLGQVRQSQHRFEEALAYFRRALPTARRVGGGRPEAIVEANLGEISLELGQFRQALTHAERELQLRRQAGDQVGEADVMHRTAVARQALGEHERSIDIAGRAAALFRQLAGAEQYLATALVTAATSWEHLGDLARAHQLLQEAAALLDGFDEAQAEALATRAADIQHRVGGGQR
ncbi:MULTISPECIES: tetratricopeptide repeat protein [unclassified Crossiella]|uniref:ATP-binding protein n=1 Tax=unclassified Crossiella TaxID=2620835 RepID=UPI001FFE7946|nr:MULTISPECIES: tetratricopeptide repeat protein [unclassified Crossiella]MCK2239726.1 tetratricopeptide repeat protein [Crossiella sp. S99.2]MCK2252421.1 tetratricopeptide repeat protein [Crossiella sp. S99.1]